MANHFEEKEQTDTNIISRILLKQSYTRRSALGPVNNFQVSPYQNILIQLHGPCYTHMVFRMIPEDSKSQPFKRIELYSPGERVCGTDMTRRNINILHAMLGTKKKKEQVFFTNPSYNC